jgi:hypothetical protein
MHPEQTRGIRRGLFALLYDPQSLRLLGSVQLGFPAGDLAALTRGRHDCCSSRLPIHDKKQHIFATSPSSESRLQFFCCATGRDRTRFAANLPFHRSPEAALEGV